MYCNFCPWKEGDKYIILNIKDILADTVQRQNVKIRFILCTWFNSVNKEKEVGNILTPDFWYGASLNYY